MNKMPRVRNHRQDQLYGRMALRNRFEDIKHLVTMEDPTIIDGGANLGSTIDSFLNMYESPEIHAFEPIPKFVKLLEERFGNHKNIHIYPFALGALKKTVNFNILNYPHSSSILQPETWNYKYHGNKMQTSDRIDVDQIRIDEFLSGIKINILKLDLQGYELEALKGCEKMISDIKVVMTEIAFVPLYRNQALFSDIDIYLRDHNFRLYNLYELWTQMDGQLTAGDAIYLNQNFIEN